MLWTTRRIGWRGVLSAGAAIGAIVLFGALTLAAANRPRPAARTVPAAARHHDGLSRLQALPMEAQSVISSTLGSGASAFDARRTPTGWELSGGGVAADVHGGHVTLRARGATVSMALAGVGRGRDVVTTAVTSTFSRGNRVTLDRGATQEWYAAGPLGIEQGFTVGRRPAGDAGRLTLALGVTGGAGLVSSRSAVVFTSPSGQIVLRYGGLESVDSAGKRLASTLSEHRGRLTLSVDDVGARYPITVDPLVEQGTELTGRLDQNNSNGGGVEFGWSVALSGDGDTALIGGQLDNGGAGAAWVFTRSGSTWSQQGHKLTGGGPSGNASNFGSSVALSPDGSTALIGGAGDGGAQNTFQDGAAWVFTRSGSTWTQQGTKLVGDCTSGCGGPQGMGETSLGQFGISAALSNSGDTALIGASGTNNGAGAAWVFTRTNGTWSEQREIGPIADRFPINGLSNVGDAVALSGNGNTALIGGKQDNGNVGAAWVYTRDTTGVWTEQEKIPAPNDQEGASLFGSSVALSNDGGTAVVGGELDGPLMGSTDSGAAWVFTRAGSVWNEQAKLVGAGLSGTTPQFGSSVALSQDGNAALVGANMDANNVGSAFRFTRSGTTWTQDPGKLTGGQEESGNAFFGTSVALSGDGQTALVGGPSDTAELGAAWPFAPPAPSCTDVSATTPIGGGSAIVKLSCSAPAGATPSYRILGGPGHGSLGAVNPATGQVTYSSQSGFAGQDAFTYQFVDQWGASNVATASVSVPALPVPTCSSVSLRAPKGATKVVVPLVCTGLAGHPFSYVVVTPPGNGKLGPIDESHARVTYTPRTGFSGSDRFIYAAANAAGRGPVAIATITIPRLPHITSTMAWQFQPTLSTSTVVRHLVVNAVPGTAAVKLACAVKRCPIKARSQQLAKRRVCKGKGKRRKCRALRPANGTIDLSKLVAGKRVKVGTVIKVSIVEPKTIGKQYIFKIRANRQPAVTIISLAPGTTKPCPGC